MQSKFLSGNTENTFLRQQFAPDCNGKEIKSRSSGEWIADLENLV
jgi:hypothetical protein